MEKIQTDQWTRQTKRDSPPELWKMHFESKNASIFLNGKAIHRSNMELVLPCSSMFIHFPVRYARLPEGNHYYITIINHRLTID